MERDVIHIDGDGHLLMALLRLIRQELKHGDEPPEHADEHVT